MKKLLALFLALVAHLTIMPLTGAAFSDEVAIGKEYKVAVEEMAQKGIINGFTDGSFGPRKTLTRAQAAKILCVMLEGTEKAEALTKTETGFEDVPATHWAAKFVAYCAEKGIVSGVGDGKFDPDGQLSSAAFAKMLLVANGADGAGFTGAEWLQNVQKAAEPTFLMFHMPEKLTTDALQRQGAAQLAFNAMFEAEAKAAKTTKDISRSLPTSVPESIKILAVGNSFSNDCTLEYLYPMLKSAGVKNLTIGNLYHSGCTLKMHTQYALGKENAYTYYKRTEADSEWTSTKKHSSKMDMALDDEKWDIIIFQHPSRASGQPGEFAPWHDLLLCYVQRKQPTAVFGVSMPWAYETGSKQKHFVRLFGGDQMKMYNAVLESVKNEQMVDARHRFLLPVGTAVQNARTSFIGDHITRDGYHLNKGIGRYIASMVWTCKLTGIDPEKLDYLPEALVANKKEYSIPGVDMSKQGLLEALGKIARESVKNALANPYEITQSQYKTAP